MTSNLSVIAIPRQQILRQVITTNTKEINLQDKLFGELAEKYATRNGGYTRIVKIGERKGDAAMEVIIELV